MIKIISGLFVGTLCGCIICYFIFIGPQRYDQASYNPVESPRINLTQIEIKMSDLCDKIDGLKFTLEGIAISLMEEKVDIENSGTYLTPQHDKNGIEVMQDSKAENNITKVENARKDLGWTKLLEPALARALVECGLTPFDPGVPEILSKASDDYRNAQDELNEVIGNLKDAMGGEIKTSDDLRRFGEDRKKLDRAFRIKKQSICDEFRRELRKLMDTEISK